MTITPEAPIIFIHYGDNDYLKFTLQSAKMFNPHKRVVLLGDEENAHYSSCGIEYIPFSRFETGEDLNTFNKVFQYVAGEKHTYSKTKGVRHWTDFVFRRWFLIHQFLLEEDIEAFWTFDTDNLILENLSPHEPKFSAFDCTEQCGGSCMNGFINTRVVEGYLKTINALFESTEYLELQREEFKKKPEWGFTEMRAYVAYRNNAGLKTCRLNRIINDETFDDCICAEDDMQTVFFPPSQSTIKRYGLRADGRIFSFRARDRRPIRLITINMSWVPTYLIERIFKHALLKLHPNEDRQDLALKPLNIEVPHRSLRTKMSEKVGWLFRSIQKKGIKGIRIFYERRF